MGQKNLLPLVLRAVRIIACSSAVLLVGAACKKKLALDEFERHELQQAADTSCRCVADRSCMHIDLTPSVSLEKPSEYRDEDRDFILSTAKRATDCIEKHLQWLQDTNQLAP